MESDMPHQVRLTVAASFLPHFFLENLAIRRDNSILVTVATRKELWYSSPAGGRTGRPHAPSHLR
jgi:hypothetical protein